MVLTMDTAFEGWERIAELLAQVQGLAARLLFIRVIRIIRLRFGSPVASALQTIEAVIETVNDRRSRIQPDVFRDVSIARRLSFIGPCRSFVPLVARLVITLIVYVVNQRRPLQTHNSIIHSRKGIQERLDKVL
jgi:hypothetical protein